MTNDDHSDLSRRDVLKGAGGVTGSVGLASLGGCLGQGSGGDGNGSSENSSGGDGGGGSPAKVLFWTASFDDEASKPWADWYKSTYDERHSNADLKVSSFTYMDRRKKFLTGARQGKPDYIEGLLSHLSEFQKADLLEPITEQAKNLDYWEGFTEGAKDAVTYKGEVWGMPWTGNGRALLYRKDIFEELGLEPPETAAEFHEVGRTINEERDDMTAFHNCTKEGSVRAFQEWMSHVYQHEDNLYTMEDDSWKLVPSAETLGTIFTNWYYEVWASDVPLANPEQRGTGWQTNDYGYLNGDYAMIECGPWIQGMVSEDGVDDSSGAKAIVDEKTTVKHLPHASDGKKATYLEVKPIMVNKHSSNTELAWEGVKQYTSLESFRQMKEAGMPIATPMHTEVSTTLENDDWTAFGDVIETGRPLAKIKWGSIRTAYYTEMQQVVYGKKDPMKAGKDLHKKLSDITSELTV